MIEHPVNNTETPSSTATSEQELAALRNELAFYRAAFRALPNDMLVLFDTHMRYVAAGGQPIDALGIHPQDFPGHTAHEIIPAAIKEQVLTHYEQALSGTSSHGQLSLNDQVFATTVVPLHDENGTLIGGMGLSRLSSDVDKQRQQLELYQAIVEQAPYSIVITDLQRRLSLVNQAHLNLYNYESLEQVLDADGFQLAPEEDLEHIKQEIAPAVMKYGIWQGHLRAQRRDGSSFWSDQTVKILTNHAGQPIGSASFAKDISIEVEAREEREQLLHQLSEHEYELRVFKELVERAPLGIAIGTLDSLITYANPAYMKLTGLHESVIGEPFTVIYGPEGREQATQAAAALEHNGFWSAQIPALHPDGSPWITQVTTYMLSDPNNANRQWAAFYSDVTDQVRLAEERTELQKQTLAAQEHALAAQEAALRELSTPLIPITDKVVVMPLVGSIDSRRAQMVMESLLEGVSRIQAQTVILDITGVPIVDTQVANALLHATQALKLLGARVLLTGIRPEVAQTLVSLGTNLGMIEISRDLRSAISTVLR